MIKFKKLDTAAIIPQRQTGGAAGFDLYALIDEPIILGQGEYVTVPTGIAAAIPAGWVGLVQARSGWAVKNGIIKMAGVIDSDYRGEIAVILTKAGKGEFHINAGDRIAQLVVTPFMGDSEEVYSLDETERGANGFGSTGAC